MCLDVLRAMEREPQACVVLLDELQRIADLHSALQPALLTLKQLLTLPGEQLEMLARRLVQQLMLTVQIALMLQHAPTAMAEAFALSRQDPGHGRVYGTMPLTDAALQQAILQRAWPVE